MKTMRIHDGAFRGMSLLAVVLLTGCGLPTSQILPQVSGENPPADKSLIIVDRTPGSLGAWVNNSVVDNKTKVGSIGKGGKLAWLRDPGPMRLSCSGPSYESLGGAAGKVLVTAANKTYHFTIDYSHLDDFQVSGPGVPFMIAGDKDVKEAVDTLDENGHKVTIQTH